MDDLFSRLAGRAIDARRTVRPQTAPVFAAVTDIVDTTDAPPPLVASAPVSAVVERHESTPPSAPTGVHDSEQVAPGTPALKAELVQRIDVPPLGPEWREARPARADVTLAPDEPARTEIVTPRESEIKVGAEPVAMGDTAPPQAKPAVVRTEFRTATLQPQVIGTIERAQRTDVKTRREHEAQVAPPVIEVTIGQIEVRTPPASAPRELPDRKPALSLEAYAAERRDGRR